MKSIDKAIYGMVSKSSGGNESERTGDLENLMEKKIRRHLMRARKREGFGWKRWSKQWLYNTLGLFNVYRVVPSRQLKAIQHASVP